MHDYVYVWVPEYHVQALRGVVVTLIAMLLDLQHVCCLPSREPAGHLSQRSYPVVLCLSKHYCCIRQSGPFGRTGPVNGSRGYPTAVDGGLFMDTCKPRNEPMVQVQENLRPLER
jgi:hypothetical protein